MQKKLSLFGEGPGILPQIFEICLKWCNIRPFEPLNLDTFGKFLSHGTKGLVHVSVMLWLLPRLLFNGCVLECVLNTSFAINSWQF